MRPSFSCPHPAPVTPLATPILCSCTSGPVTSPTSYAHILLRSSDTESILIMVAAEEGISILPSYVTDKLGNADNLVFVPLEGEEEAEEIIAAWKVTGMSVPLRQFVDRL